MRCGRTSSAGGLPAVGRTCAAAIKIVVLTVDPEMIVFGGSVTAAHELFEESMYEDLKDFAYPNSIKNLKIRFL